LSVTRSADATHIKAFMSDHKFKVGQTLNFNPHRLSSHARPAKCKIIRLISGDGDNRQYRVKCTTESFERVVWESELE
jgi:hypothetical protein